MGKPIKLKGEKEAIAIRAYLKGQEDAEKHRNKIAAAAFALGCVLTSAACYVALLVKGML